MKPYINPEHLSAAGSFRGEQRDIDLAVAWELGAYGYERESLSLWHGGERIKEDDLGELETDRLEEYVGELLEQASNKERAEYDQAIEHRLDEGRGK